MPSNAMELMRLMVVREPDPRLKREAIPLRISPKLAELTGRLDYRRAREALRKFGSAPANIIASVADLPQAKSLNDLRMLASTEDVGVSAGKLIERAFGQPAKQVVELSDWSAMSTRLADSIVVYKLGYTGGPRPLAELADLYRAATFVELTANSQGPGPARAVFDAPLALPLSFSRKAGQADEPSADALETRRQKATELALELVRKAIKLDEDEKAVTKALNEIASIPINASNFTLGPKVLISASPARSSRTAGGETADAGHDAVDSLAVNWSLMRHGLTSASGGTIIGAPQPGLRLTSAAAKAVTPDVKKAISDHGLNIDTDPVEQIADTLAVKRQELRAAREALDPPAPRLNTGWLGGVSVSHASVQPPVPKVPPIKVPADIRIPEGLHIDWNDLLVNCGWPGQPPQPEPEQDRGPSLLKPAGIGELFVIRQHITGYRSGEVSHVENVLPGETRERQHRRLRQQEDTTTEEQEQIQEDEKSVQTTNRAELEREVQTTIKKQFDYGASAQVSGDYGKVEFAASGQVAGSTASETASKTAQKVASEVIEISRQRVTERVRTERTRRTLEEVEETNLHKFSGEELTEPFNGVYQWIDKVYLNEVWSYGNRTMYEVVVPEPAAGLIAAATLPAAQSPNLVEKPAPLNVSIEAFTPSRVAQLCAQYGVTEDIDPYPEPVLVSVAFSQSSDDNASNNFYAETKDVDVPDGYEMLDGWIAVRARGEDRTPMIGVTVGTATCRFFTQNIKYADQPDTIPTYFKFNFESDEPIVKKLQAAIAVDDYSAFAASVMLRFRPSPAHIDTWRRKAYSAIRGAFDARMSEWREYQSQVDFDKPEISEKLFGRNPETNRSLVRQELQRTAIEVFRNLSLDFDLIREGSSLDPVPRSDFPGLAQASPEILFLSQAFEWNNMTFILYPYFYGRRKEWPLKMQFSDLDANFIEFLKCGAARVQVPVRPGFEAAVDHYMLTREPYFGRGMPEIGDDLYLPYLDEAREAMGAELGGEHRSDLDFEVAVPTSLVVARNNEKIDTSGGMLPVWAKSGETWIEIPVQ